jgi:uncharacterized glyoxalase superfamily protein PhnB
MRLTSSYPVLLSGDVRAAAAFYRDVFGFGTTFESSWYVSLSHGGSELALLDPGHETIPEGFRGSAAAGVLLNLEVDDVDAVYADLSGRPDVEVVLPLRSEDFGQRHFILAGPDRVLVDVITPIAPQGAYTDAFAT